MDFGKIMFISGYGLVDLLKSTNKKELIGIELGCGDGDTTLHLLSNLPNLTLYGIDPYIGYDDFNGHNPAEMLAGNLVNTMRKIDPYKDRFTLYRDISDNVVDKFDDGSLDFIFIDGLHSYDQVLKDCDNYYPKIKKGGLFSGHDYRVIDSVNRAVNEFAAKVSVSEIGETQNDVWYWVK